MEEQAKKHFIIDVIFIGIWVVLLLFAGKFLLSYLFPFVVAVVVAAAVQKPAEAISRKIKFKKGICAATLSAIIYLTVASVIVFLAIKLFGEMGDLFSAMGGTGESIRKIVTKIEEVIINFTRKFATDSSDEIKEIVSGMFMDFAERLSGFISDTAAKAVKTAPSLLFSGLVALAATCYIAKDFDGLCDFVKKLMSKNAAETIKKIKTILKSCILKMLGGYLILMIITFAELLVGLLIIGVKKAVFIALLIAVIDILPVLGAGTVLLPWGIISILAGESKTGIGVMVIYIVITVLRNFLEPKIVGINMGINPLFVLITMFLGLRLFGVAGLFILPVTFIVVIKYYKNEMEQETS